MFALKPRVYITLLTVIGLVLIAIIFLPREYVYKGSSYEPFPDAPNVALTDQHGNQFELTEHKGEVVLVFFGYTNCPDVCPLTLAKLAQVKIGLGGKADQVQFVFVTEDPERDTKSRLKEYLSSFDPDFIGLTGQLEEMQPVWDAYHVVPIIEPFEGDEEGYTVAHSGRVFVIDVFGHLRLTFPYEMTIEDMIEDVSHLVDEAQQN